MIAAVVPQQKNKHLPLIKHPSGHRESVCLLQPFFSPPLYLLTVRNICHWEKNANKTGNARKAARRKAILYHRRNFCLHSTLLRDRAVQ